MEHIDTFVVKAGLASGSRSEDTKMEVAFVVSGLQLRPGAKVLDLPCGNGRHAVLLARKGYRVTGVDASRDCIEIARAKHGHRNVAYKRLDVNSAGRIGQMFDAVISLLSCIGYFATDSENAGALRSLLSVLNTGGRVMLSTANRGFVERLGKNTTVFDGSKYLIERCDDYDAATRCLDRRFLVLDKSTGRRRSISQRRRIYSKTEMVKLLRSCGVGSIRCFADYTGSPFVGNRSPHAIYVGTKRV